MKRTGSMTPRSFKSAIPRSTWRSPSPVLHEMLRMRDASVINHHLEVPLRTLDCVYGYGEQDDRSDSHSGNMIIHGDNLEALKALLPEYECSWASPWRPWR